jgi:hypothetical protein
MALFLKNYVLLTFCGVRNGVASTSLSYRHCAFCDAAIRSKIHKVNTQKQTAPISKISLKMLEKIKLSTITVTSNDCFFSHYNHFYDVSYAFFLYVLIMAIFPACRDRQICDLSRTLVK